MMFIKELFNESGFDVNYIEDDNQIVRVFVWNCETNELILSIESFNRVDYTIRTYGLDNLTENNRKELKNATSDMIRDAIGEIIPIVKQTTADV